MGMSRDFKGIWIPKQVWFTKELSLQEKIFMVEIDSLNAKENEEKHCFATNKYFATFFGLSKNRCSSIIKELEKKGYITIAYKREGKEITERYIDVSQKWNTLFRNQNLGIPKTDKGYSENSEEDNTKYYNTKDSNKDIYIEEVETVANKFKTICTLLPQPRKITESRKKAIKSILKSYSIDEVIEVFNNVQNSEFLTVKWQANFDWIFKPANFIKILEGNYKNKQTSKKDGFYRADANIQKEDINVRTIIFEDD